VRQFVERSSGKLVGEFTEVRSGSKKVGPQLKEALRICCMRRAVLVIARLDRLSRNMALISTLIESDIEFVAVDAPYANTFTLHILAATAEYESSLMSERTKAALAQAKARGVKIGGYKGDIERLRAAGAEGRAVWSAQQKARALDIAPIAWGIGAKGRSLKAIASTEPT
jgi:DNA invertase Pin-like site-specific DNA recombinase